MKKPLDPLVLLLSPVLIVRSTSRPIHEASLTLSQTSQSLYSCFHLPRLVLNLCVKRLPWSLRVSEAQIDVECKFAAPIRDEEVYSGLLQPSPLHITTFSIYFHLHFSLSALIPCMKNFPLNLYRSIPVQAMLKIGMILKGSKAS